MSFATKIKVLQKSPQPLKHKETLLGDKNISVGCGLFVALILNLGTRVYD